MVTEPKYSPAASDVISTVTSTLSGAVPESLSSRIQLGNADAVQVIVPRPIFVIVNFRPAGIDPSVEVNVRAEGVGATDSWGIAVRLSVDGPVPKPSSRLVEVPGCPRVSKERRAPWVHRLPGQTAIGRLPGLGRNGRIDSIPHP